MARPELSLRETIVPTRGPRRAAQDWQTSIILLAATLGALYGLHTILIGVGWFFPLALVALLVLAASAIVRLFTVRLWLPPLVSIVAFLASMTAFFAPQTALLAVIPTGDTVTAFTRLVSAAELSINIQTVPAEADTGILFLLCFGVAALVLAADLAAVTFRAPALAGVPILILLTIPGDVQPSRTDLVAILIAGVSYLVLLRVGSRAGQGRLALGFGAIVAAVTIVLPLALPPTGASTTATAGTGFGTGVNPVLTLGADLRQNADRKVLSYTTKSGDSEYLRLVSITDFAGANWAPEQFTLNTGHSVAKLPAPPGLTAPIATLQDTTRVNIISLTSKWLPLPYPTKSVKNLAGSWYWDTEGLAVSSPDNQTTGQAYTVSDLEVQPTAQQLEASGVVVPDGMAKYLGVPRDLPDVVGQTARQVAGSATTNYAKALALQSYFHDGAFVYSETAPVTGNYDGTGEQVIAKFLQTKSGYCIHFASAMAMMARVLGIPSRISVGFLPGKRTTENDGTVDYVVTSHDLHAWPELYFEGVGWVRFEPTVSKGNVPSYADATLPDNTAAASGSTAAPTPTPAPTRPAVPVETPQPSSSAFAAGGSTTDTGFGALGWLLLVALVLVLGAFTPGIIRSAQRSRRLSAVARQRAPVLTAWREVLQTSEDVGAPVPNTLTPREAAALLPEGRALDGLLDALETEQFARAAGISQRAAQDAREIVAALLGDVAWWRRLGAVLFPASIWGHLGGARSTTRRPEAP